MKFRGVYRSEAYVTVNVAGLKDRRLSLKAKGLLVLLCSWEPGADLTVAAVMALTYDGRDSVNTAWSELKERGYLVEAPDGVRIEENPQRPTVAIAEIPQSPVLRIVQEPELVVEEEVPPGLSTSAEKPRSGRAKLRENPTSKSRRPKGDRGKTEISNRGDRGKKATPGSNALSGRIHRGKGIEEEESSGGAQVSFETLDGLSDQARTVMTTFRNSWVGKWERMGPILSDEAMLGIDVLHYFNAILRWSDKQPPNVKKNKRTVYGWVATLRDAMSSDRDKGKLRMIGAKPATNGELDGAARFLSIGR